MEQSFYDNHNIQFRTYSDNDFIHIQELNKQEGWSSLVERFNDTKRAWDHSNVKFVACKDEKVIGYIRGMTDTCITLYICEILVGEEYRGYGIGTKLLKNVHEKFPQTRIELLGSSSSHTYYEKLHFRSFYGYRKTFVEW